MRRQARISKGGALMVRTASALQVWLWLLLFVFQNEFRISKSIQPGYLDFDNLPETNFTCTGKVIGGYYADLETSCQMFHVCTVGQQEEPMDIKFLCLNGTVFDQETRVCERVDEVDCTKSEKFYSLNLELYGNTIPPPTIQEETSSPHAQPTEQSNQQAKPNQKQEPDPSIDEPATTGLDKTQSHEQPDSTDDPIQDVKREEQKPQDSQESRPQLENVDHSEYEDEDAIDEYEEDYSHPTTTTTAIPVTTTSTTTTTTTTTQRAPTSSYLPAVTTSRGPTSSHIISPSPSLASIFAHSSLTPSAPPAPTIDPAYLSPQEFIYQHRGPGSEAISFQRQSIRPADGVYITHAPPQQYDHFQYESSRTAPRPAPVRPSGFVQRPQPFRPTTPDPHDQLLRPGPTSQPSEKYETSIKHRPQNYQLPQPAQRPLPFNPYYYDRKRSDNSNSEDQSSLAARSVAPPTVTERPPTKLKSPPRVIVTASASVSDSNGKRLNYTVGNVVSAVKPIVPINYDDYKESDLIFDPFFLDVPKLQKRRKSRSSRNRKIVSVPVTQILDSTSVRSSSPPTSRVTAIEKTSTATSTTSAPPWNPDDYVDDNYEPQSYVPPAPPVVVLQNSKFGRQERQSVNDLVESRNIDRRSKVGRTVSSRPTSSAQQTTSSQSTGASAVPPHTRR